MATDMQVTRRHILQTGAAVGASAFLPSPSLAQPNDSRWIGCRKLGDTHYATQFDTTGKIWTNTPLPSRGHGITVSPDGRTALIVARRPGTYALWVDLESGETLTRIEGAPHRHFYGHACFSRDGTHIFMTENDTRSGAGLISVRDTSRAFEELDHFPTGGIGPHELALLPDGKTIAIANGGILTRPETGRTPLNLESMAPSLTLFDITTGKINTQHRLPASQHQLSIRHMSVHQNEIALALQFEGPRNIPMPLLALFDGVSLRLIDTPDALARRMRNYAGSISHDLSGDIIAMTCPKANLVTFWAAKTGEPLGQTRAGDVCGAAPGKKPGEFVLTARADILTASFTGHHADATFSRSQWDNHLTRIA